jgi:DNA-binding MarR family transcriptional regulator
MIQPFCAKFITPTKFSRRLAVLLSIQNAPRVSQHKIARSADLSSSMVNNYIKRLKREGLITVRGDTNRTQSYHLTSLGQNELKDSLLLYSAEIVQLYSSVKRQIAKMLNTFYAEGIRTLVLFGIAETAEVVYAAVRETGLVVIGAVDSDESKQGQPFNGLIIRAPEQLKQIKPDAVLITSFAKQDEIRWDLQRLVNDEIDVKTLTDL